MGLPTEAELAESEAAELLFTRQDAGESQWRIAQREPLSVLVQTPGIPSELFIQFEDQIAGLWGIRSGAGGQVIGRAVLATTPNAGAGP